MTRLLRFDEPALRRITEQISPRNACALGLAAACRLLSCISTYRQIAGLPQTRTHEEVASHLWREVCSSGPLETTTVWEVPYENLLALIPNESDPWNEWHPLAEDGAAALAYSVAAWSNAQHESAVYALRRVFEATDQLAIHRLRLEAAGKQDEEAILAEYCVQQELLRQSRDIALAQQGDRETLQQLAYRESILDPASGN